MTEIANDPTRRMTGGRALAEMLKLHECGPMFGMGGFQLLPFYDAVRELGLGHTLINDERCGAFAADAFARVSGRPGVCDATLGPGATNLATGLVESLNAGVPLIAIIGNTNRAHSWKNMTQESRQDEILAPAAKELIRVEDGNRMPELVRRAYTVATSGRPGPVVLDVPEDVAHGEFDYPRTELRAGANRIPARRIRPGRAETEAAAALLRRSRRPLILAGGGVHLSGAWTALRALAEAESIPVAHTLSGKGSLPCGHPLGVGLFGRWSRIANDLMERSDCLLAVGCKMGEISTRRYVLPPASVPFIQLDVVAEEIGRSNRVDAGLWGDAAEGLRDLAAALADDDPAARRAGREPWLADAAARMAKWREEAEPRYASDERPIHMARLIRELQQVMPEEGVLVVDGGFAAHWTGLLYDSPRAGRCYVANRGFASIGYGLPGAMGAQLAARAELGDAPRRRPDRRRGLQHGAGGARNGPPPRARPHPRHRQQRGERLRQGAPAQPVRRQLPVGGPERDGLCGGRPRPRLRGPPGGGPGRPRSRVPGRHGLARRTDRHRRGGDPRPREDAPGGGQPRRPGASRRPPRLSASPGGPSGSVRVRPGDAAGGGTKGGASASVRRTSSSVVEPDGSGGRPSPRFEGAKACRSGPQAYRQAVGRERTGSSGTGSLPTSRGEGQGNRIRDSRCVVMAELALAGVDFRVRSAEIGLTSRLEGCLWRPADGFGRADDMFRPNAIALGGDAAKTDPGVRPAYNGRRSNPEPVR